MQKLPMHTKNQADENFKKLAELFPQAVTEVVSGYDEHNKPIIERAIDKDVLMAEIAARVVDGNEQRYQFTWPDKAKTVHASNQPIYKTLRPVRSESVNFNDTENLYIEGDNLEVLKLLQESYLGKVKMIYIDPPYNTGNDFVYNDRFTMDGDDWDEVSGDYDEEGNRLFKNTDSNGRFHTDWLNMLYPRLKIARDLLSDDGVIFISIDDNEVHNLRKICDEVFGANNFMANVVWQKKYAATNDAKGFSNLHDHIIVYRKSLNFIRNLLPRTAEQNKPYKNDDGDGKGLWRSDNLLVRTFSQSGVYPIQNPNTGEDFYPPSGSCWRASKDTMKVWLSENRIFFGKDGKGAPQLKRYLNEVQQGRVPHTWWTFQEVGHNDAANKELQALFSAKTPFDTPKPISLIKQMLVISTKPNDIILDFFSGSATTAHAVMQLNAEEGGKRKFIMVQLPEVTDEKSEAFKAGYKNICEIGKERIRRAGAKLMQKITSGEGDGKGGGWGCGMPTTKDEWCYATENILDIGFRVLKIDSSNFADNVARTPSETNYKTIMQSVDNIKHDRKPEDLLFYAMLQLGIPLSSKVNPIELHDKKIFEVYYADMLYLTASFDKNLTESIITEIAQKKPLYFVMRDNSQASDSVATNFDEIFKLYSPSTERWVL